MDTFKEFREKGLLWALNRHVFHPRGYAVAFHFDDDGNVIGWSLLGDGTDIWAFEPETDENGFERFNAFLKALGD